MKKLRIGSVPYLNVKPFFSGFDNEKIVYIPPARLAPELRQGHVDIAIVPVFECLSYPHYKILNDLCISSTGAVKSVILQHKCPIPEIRSIAADSHSLTSVNLLKVLLKSYWKISPQIIPEGEDADGELWIGDRALRAQYEHRNDRHTTDLGQAWMEFTGLPFVYAVWAVSPQSECSAEDLNAFRKLCKESVDQRHRIATSAEELEYFTRYIQYDMTEAKQKAITRFRQECLACGFIAENKTPLVYI